MVRKRFQKHFAPLARGKAKLQSTARQIERNLGIIETEGARLTRLINDFLDLSRIESGRLEWNDQPVHIEDVVHGAVEATRAQYDAKPSVSLHVELEPDLPELVADPDRLTQVLVNLLNNAGKFTEKGTVRVAATATQDGLIRVSVADTGPGIPREEQELVFDKFHQVRHGDTLPDTFKGTGLGLAICKQIIERYGGAIWVESDGHAGSDFIFELPVPTPDASQP
jgi:signal transduction histidine kinase